MNAHRITLEDVKDVLAVLEDAWGPIHVEERDRWAAALIGRPADTLADALGHCAGGADRPTLPEFVAALTRSGDAVTPLYRDDRRASTFVRVCQAWCRRVVSGDTEWRDLLGWGDVLPTVAVFERTMREVADGVPAGTADIDHAVTEQLRARR